LPPYDPIISSTAVLLVASLLSFCIWPDFFFFKLSSVPLISGISLILLGALPTGIAALLYFTIINSSGATFLSNINYLIPVVAFFLGALLLGEDILWQNILALLLIISGIFISRFKI
jgi:drug/metabolite transporter (DMT)-like permease